MAASRRRRPCQRRPGGGRRWTRRRGGTLSQDGHAATADANVHAGLFSTTAGEVRTDPGARSGDAERARALGGSAEDAVLVVAFRYPNRDDAMNLMYGKIAVAGS